MIQNRIVTVFGAYGHTGRFVVSELRKRGFTPILSGRDAAKLKEAGNAHPGSELRVATVNDSASLNRALSGAAAVINCAGPFIDTAAQVIDAALCVSVHYLDIAAEQAAVLAVFERFGNATRDAGVYGRSTRRVIVLKITITETQTQNRWTLQGQLIGPWVREPGTVWRKAHGVAFDFLCRRRINMVFNTALQGMA